MNLCINLSFLLFVLAVSAKNEYTSDKLLHKMKLLYRSAVEEAKKELSEKFHPHEHKSTVVHTIEAKYPPWSNHVPYYMPIERHAVLTKPVIVPMNNYCNQVPTWHPIQYKPVEYKPIEYKPVEYKPVEYKPVEYKPVEYKPVEYKPVEYKPVEYKPVQVPVQSFTLHPTYSYDITPVHHNVITQPSPPTPSPTPETASTMIIHSKTHPDYGSLREKEISRLINDIFHSKKLN